MTVELEATGLSVRYGGNIAVDGVDLAVPTGKMVGMVGANGAGKSTLINALAGWSRGTPVVRGTVRLGGSPMDNLSPHRRAAQGLVLVPEGKGIFSELTVMENLALVRPPADTARRSPSLLDGGDPRALPAPGRAASSQGPHAVRWRAADGGGEPRAPRRAPGAAARRAVGGPGAATGLRAARNDAQAGRSRPVAAAGRAERARDPGAGRRALPAGARQGGGQRTGRVDEERSSHPRGLSRKPYR